MINKKNECMSYVFERCVCLLFLLSCFGVESFAQARTVTGTVKDENGDLLPGVSVQLLGVSIGTITDSNGNFSIKVEGSAKSTLRFSFIGYKSEDVSIEGKNYIELEMDPDIANLEEVVIVGYGTQKRVSITGAVNSIKPADLSVASTASVATALTGRLPGTVIVQNSGMAGSKAANISIRGSSNFPLVLVDGIERSFQDLDMDEIESISVLKDASATAVYGIRGGNGVIIVTTKRGKEGKFKINLKTEFGLIQKGKSPAQLNSYEFAMLQNEGNRNDKFVALDDDTFTNDLYSQEDLELYKNGLDPLLHPSYNWFDYLTNDFGHRERYNLTISGGNNFFKSFTTIGYMNERDVFKDYDVGYDNRSYYRRYNVRTNIDLDVTPTTKVSVDLGGQFGNLHKPNVDFKDLSLYMYKKPAIMGSLYNGKIVLAESTTLADHPLAQIYDVGYVDNYTNQLQFAVKLSQQLDFITKGLNLDMVASYDHGFTNNYTATRSAPVYYVGFTDPNTGENTTMGLEVDPSTGYVKNPYTGTWVPQSEVELLRSGTEGKLTGSRGTGTKSRNINFKARLHYMRGFGKHNVAAMGVFTVNSQSFHTQSDNYIPLRYVEAAARLSYNYDERYFIEFNGGYNGSETFAKDNRFGFFPAVSAGWVLSSEPYFPQNRILTFLKFRGSYGTTGIDKGINRFMYFDEYTLNYRGGYLFGLTPVGLGIATQTAAGNMDVTWATNYQTNIAIETKWLDNRLNINMDIYRYDKEGIMMEPNSVPSIVAAQLPAGNLKKLRYEGYEIQLGWEDKIGQVHYNLFANYSHANAINKFIDEIKPAYEWQVRTGKHPNNIKGLKCVGFYTQEDIDWLNENMNEGKGTKDIPSSSYGTLHAGDLKYKDMNEDGIINDDDMQIFENTTVPKSTFGLGGNFRWKNFGLNVFFQGVSDVTYSIGGSVRIPFQSGRSNGAAFMMQRWTPERYAAGEEILFPRMSASCSASDHNFQDSDFWLRNASYIRLKNLELSYRLRTDGLKKIGVDAVNITLSGTNLLTWSSLKIVDPETQSGHGAPIPPNKVYTLGLNLSF